ncbi:MAG: hypothetical protein MRY63_11495 [Neomegalonema sp.]|nr:hypothetical protein [Neomegalonema sp.]
MQGYDFAQGLFAATKAPQATMPMPSAQTAVQYETRWDGPIGSGHTPLVLGPSKHGSNIWIGQYPHGSGRIQGTYSRAARRFEGIWRQDYATQDGDGDLGLWGEVSLRFDARLKRFTGTWNIGGEGESGHWTGALSAVRSIASRQRNEHDARDAHDATILPHFTR